jgi:hypothetical protein
MDQFIGFLQRLYSGTVTQLQEKIGADYQRHTGSEASVPPRQENMEDPPGRPHRSWWRRPQFPPGYVHQYWEQVGKDLPENLALSKRIFVALLAYVVASTAALYFAEHAANHNIDSLGSALYYTWVTMATVGNADPADPWGRLITATDVAVGLLTFGFVVWLITKSLTQTSSLKPTAIEQRLDRIEERLSRPTIDERVIELLRNLQPRVKETDQAKLNEVLANITHDPATGQLTRAATTTAISRAGPPDPERVPDPAPKKPD